MVELEVQEETEVLAEMVEREEREEPLALQKLEGEEMEVMEATEEEADMEVVEQEAYPIPYTGIIPRSVCQEQMF